MHGVSPYPPIAQRSQNEKPKLEEKFQLILAVSRYQEGREL
jgi:hypothetical protein